MDSKYHTLAGFVGSWWLLVAFIVFILIVLWVFRPGSRKAQNEAANQIFRNEDAPPSDGARKDDKDGR